MSSGHFCASCHQEISIDEKKLEDEDKLYHLKCFICDKCGLPISTGAYLQVDGERICQNCRVVEVCRGCGFAITNEVALEFEGKAWHKNCFICFTCRKPLQKFFEKNHQYFCAECVKLPSDHSCCKCGKEFKDPKKILKVLEKNWHPECFRCHNCDRDVSDYYSERRGFPYCRVCERKSIPSRRQASSQNKNLVPNLQGLTGNISPRDKISPRGNNISPRDNSVSPRDGNQPLKRSPSAVPEAIREGLDPKKKFISTPEKPEKKLW